MSDENGKPAVSKAQRAGMVIGFIVVFVGFELLQPEKTEPGFDFTRVLWAAVAGAVGATLGAVVGRAFER
jgi:hypothetical protein